MNLDTHASILSSNDPIRASEKAALIEFDCDGLLRRSAVGCHRTKQEKKGKEESKDPNPPKCAPRVSHEKDESNIIISDSSDSSMGDSDDGYESSISSINDENDSLCDWDLQSDETTKSGRTAWLSMERESTKSCRPVKKRRLYSSSTTCDVPPVTPNISANSVGPIHPRPILPGIDYFLSPSTQLRIGVKSNAANEWPLSTIMSSGNISLIHYDHSPTKQGEQSSDKESNKTTKGRIGKRLREDCVDTSGDVLDVAMTLSQWRPESTVHPTQAKEDMTVPLCHPSLQCYLGNEKNAKE
mmetsp:Transcript_20226/g.29599  ORF Transcript_20226/g.29599 Transcript_20226/m.29599 type:complete len:299 (-) Transcript_20226:306-1202(-)